MPEEAARPQSEMQVRRRQVNGRRSAYAGRQSADTRTENGRNKAEHPKSDVEFKERSPLGQIKMQSNSCQEPSHGCWQTIAPCLIACGCVSIEPEDDNGHRFEKMEKM